MTASNWLHGKIPDIEDEIRIPGCYSPINIYLFRTTLFTESECISMLSRQEIADMSNRRQGNEKKGAAVSRAILKSLISKLTGAAPEKILIEKSEYGKPYIKKPDNARKIGLSVSHSDDRLLVGLCEGMSIGIDIECRKIPENAERILEKLADREACGKYMSAPASEKQEIFYSWWTRTEAFLKAKGKGFADFTRKQAAGDAFLRTFVFPEYIFSVCALNAAC